MIKNFVLAAAVLSLALASGCATGGNGIVPAVTVNAPNGISADALYPGQGNVMFTATVSGTTNKAVTWSVTGTNCTGTGNPCGTIDSATGVYQAPAAPVSATITATLTADTSVMGNLPITVIPVAVVVTPLAVNVGENLVQQFTAIALPDDAPQNFTWTCTPTGACGSFGPNPNSVAVYTAPASNGSVTVAATSTVTQPNPGVGTSKVTVVQSRLASGTYAFRFSGDNSSGHVAVTGSINVASNGSVTGVEDVLPALPGGNPLTITSGSYTPSANNGNNISNNLGTLTLTSGNGTTNITNIYTAVLTSSGVIRMIESASDSTGITGSGVMQKSALQQFNAGAQTFAFGFTGVDASGQRVGYVGLLTLDGNVTITSGSLDSNDNGTTTGVCGAPPCSFTGSYQQDQTFLGLWHMTVTTAITQHFDFVIAGGATQTKTALNPLTLYAISTDAVDSTHPALSGDMVYQFP
jgi:hypothetical protein